MQSNNEIPKYIPFVKVGRLLEQRIGRDHKTLLLFSGKQPIPKVNENLVNISKWILGSALDKNKNAIPSEFLNFDVETFENFSIIKPTLIMNKEYIIVSVDLSALTSEKQEEAFFEVPFLVFVLKKISSLTRDRLSIYGTFSGNAADEDQFKKKEEALREFMKDLNIGVVVFNYDDEFDDSSEASRLKIDKRIPEAHRCSFLPSEVFQEAQNQFNTLIQTLISDKWTSDKVKNTSKASNRRIKQHCLLVIMHIMSTFITIVKPVAKMIENTVKETEGDNEAIFSQVIEKLQEESKNISSIQLKEVKMKQKKNKYPSLAYKSFVIQCLKLLDDFKDKNSKVKMQEFFGLLFQQLNEVPLKSSNEDLQFLESYVRELMNIKTSFYNIFADIEPNLQSILNNVDPKQQKSALVTRISVSLKKIVMGNSESADYYLKFEKLMKDLQNNPSLEQTQKTEIKENLRDLQSQLPLLKAKAILNSQNQSPEIVIQSIKLFFKDFFKKKTTNSRIDEDMDLIIIFFKSAENLKKFGLTELALELYKKIKFFNKIEECTKQISRKLKRDPVKLSEFYKHLCDYFVSCRKYEEAVKYSQLAYESNICKENMKKMAEMRLLMENRTVPTKELDLIAKLAQSQKINAFEYCDYQFHSEFDKDIQKISVKFKEIEDISTAVEIKKVDLNKILKFQVDDDDQN